MFRFKPQEIHAWEDIALSIGKLSLAGLFVTGTMFLCHAYADTTQIAHSIPVINISR